jgi:hypothetical protein
MSSSAREPQIKVVWSDVDRAWELVFNGEPCEEAVNDFKRAYADVMSTCAANTDNSRERVRFIMNLEQMGIGAMIKNLEQTRRLVTSMSECLELHKDTIARHVLGTVVVVDADWLATSLQMFVAPMIASERPVLYCSTSGREKKGEHLKFWTEGKCVHPEPPPRGQKINTSIKKKKAPTKKRM